MMYLRYFLHIFALSASALTVDRTHLTQRDEPDGPVVDLEYARYRGTYLETGVSQFLGMRFAAPPLDDLRWRAPQDPEYIEGVEDATDFGPTCLGNSGPVLSDTTNEDCLFISVFAPSNATEHSKLPVWFFIQGGGYAGNTDQNFNGTEVVAQSNFNMVFVQINYRVGALGFLASEKIRENGDLNVGLLDQRKALEWTQKYIQLFGGNPDHVVIHGDSAGAGSVAFHLTAYGGVDQGLFVGAIAESPFLSTHRTVEESEFQFDRLAANTNCSHHADVLACIRSVDTAAIQAADVIYPFPGAKSAPLWYFLPVIDGQFSEDSLYKLFEQGKVVNVPLIVGDDNDEGTSFAPNASTSSDVLSFMKANYPHLTAADLQAINSTYPLMDPLPLHAPYFPSAAAAYGESTFVCPGMEMTWSIANHLSPSKAWNYRYNVYDAESASTGFGVPHVSEKPAIFGPGNAGACDDCSYIHYNKPIVPIVMHYWISFILSLDPNTYKDPDAPCWEPWVSDNGTIQRLKFQLNATEMETVPDDQLERCEFWKGLAGTLEQK